MSRQVVWEPNPGPQTAFQASTARVVLYGGAAGGGKSEAIITQPVRWFANPQFRGIILRRTRPELQELIDRTRTLYPQVGVPEECWSEQRSRWELPSGAVLRMGYAEYERDILNFKSDQYSYIAFDELTTFTEYQFRFMFSRNRTPANAGLPLQVRAATNPGGEGHQWVYETFIEHREPYRVYEVPVEVEWQGKRMQLSMTQQFIPATVWDNPRLDDPAAYIAGLAKMGPELAEAMLYGRWTVFEGQFFRRMPQLRPTAPPVTPDCYVIRAMDYGYIDPTCVFWLGVYPQLPLVLILDELYASELTLDDLARMIQRREQDLRRNTEFRDPPRVSVADPSCFNRGPGGQQSVAGMLATRGVWFTEANNDRAIGWGMVRNLIASETLQALEGRAPNLYKTMPTLQYNPTKRDDVQRGGQDHAADALRYGVAAYFEGAPAAPPVEKPNPEVQDTVLPKLLEEAERWRRQQRDEELSCLEV